MLKVEYLPIKKLLLHDRNPRTISDEQFKTLCESIKGNPDFFEARPVIASNRTGKLVIIAGNMRYRAAQAIGLKDIPVAVMKGLTEDKEKELMVRDNIQNGQWDMELLANDFEASDLASWGLDMELLDDKSTQGNTDDDAIPEPPAKATSKPGQIYQLGDHRLICGDSTKADTLSRLLGKERADCCFTDPPYNVNYLGRKKERRAILNDSMPRKQFCEFLLSVFKNLEAFLKPGSGFYICHGDNERLSFQTALTDAGLEQKECLIWVKNTFTLGRQDYHWQHEPILYGWKPGKAHSWYGGYDKATVIDDDVDLRKLDKKQLVQMINEFRNARNTTVVREAKPSKNDLHPTTKPVALVQALVRNSTEVGGGGAGFILRFRVHSYRMRKDGAQVLRGRARPDIHRRHHQAMAGFYWQEGGAA